MMATRESAKGILFPCGLQAVLVVKTATGVFLWFSSHDLVKLGQHLLVTIAFGDDKTTGAPSTRCFGA